jgi:DNA-binding GntR family transcriptional regulator
VTVAFDNLTLSQRVYEHPREAILADHLLPGTELSEVALSKELVTSRGPTAVSDFGTSLRRCSSMS